MCHLFNTDSVFTYNPGSLELSKVLFGLYTNQLTSQYIDDIH